VNWLSSLRFLKKSEWGVVGAFEATLCTANMKTAILSVIDIAFTNGVFLCRVCELVQIDVRRVQRWQSREGWLDDIAPGSIHAPHALLILEREAILAMALDEKYVNDAHRILTAKAADMGLFFVSASTVYNVMRTENLTADRCNRAHKSGKSTKPDRPELTGTNQRWCWDISYCHTHV
jgi:hypothetical protein